MIRANRLASLALASFGLMATTAVFAAAGCGGDESGGKVVPDKVACEPGSSGSAPGDGCGVFVSASGSDSGAGTKAAPVATLAKAIAMAGGKDDHVVYACAETFKEAIEVPEGITIYGGLNCANKSWAFGGADQKTTIAPEADKVPLTLKKGTAAIHIENVIAMAADAAAPGGSSIAAIADSTTVELVGCKLMAGAGAAGGPGRTRSARRRPPGGRRGPGW